MIDTSHLNKRYLHPHSFSKYSARFLFEVEENSVYTDGNKVYFYHIPSNEEIEEESDEYFDVHFIDEENCIELAREDAEEEALKECSFVPMMTYKRYEKNEIKQLCNTLGGRVKSDQHRSYNIIPQIKGLTGKRYMNLDSLWSIANKKELRGLNILLKDIDQQMISLKRRAREPWRRGV